MKLSIVTTLYKSSPYVDQLYKQISKEAKSITDIFSTLFKTILSRFPDFRYYVALVVVCLIVHWPLFFSDLLVNDDLTIITAIETNDYVGLKAAFVDLAKPTSYMLYRALAYISPPGTLIFNIYNFIFILVASLLFFKLTVGPWALPKNCAFVISLGAMCFPAYSVQPFAIMTLPLFKFMMFFASLLLAHRFWRGCGGYGSLLAACLCLFIACLTSSLIPFLYVFLLSFLLVELKKRLGESDEPRFNLLKGLRISVLLSAVVVSSYFYEQVFYLQHDYFGGTYNQIKLDPVLLYYNTIKSLNNAFVSHFMQIGRGSGLRLFAVLLTSLLLMTIITYYVKRERLTVKTAGQPVLLLVFLAVMVVVALIIAVFPYAAVNKMLAYEGYQSRWAMLVGVGGGLSIGLIYQLLRFYSHKWTEWVAGTVVTFFICAFILACWDDYGKWQRSALENNIVIAKLQTLEHKAEVELFCIDTNLYSEQFYQRRWYDWAWVFSKSWETNRETLGISEAHCQATNYYEQGKLKTYIPLLDVIYISISDLESFTSWMYHGKAREKYRVDRLRIWAADKQLDQLTGTEVLYEMIKDQWSTSDIINRYRQGLTVNYQ